MKMAWRDLFTYSFISPPPFHLLLSLSNCTVEGPWYRGIGRDGHTPLKYTQKHTAKNSLSNQHQWLFFLLPVFHRSFSLVIHKSAKCPFQAAHKHPHRSLKMPPHSEARAVVGSEPTAVQLPTVRKWWMSGWMCTLVCQARPMDFGLRCPSELPRLWSRGVNVNGIYLYGLKMP